jgi:four helix bundle protein
MISKLGIVEGELAETQLWLELLTDSGIVAHERLAPLMQESEELLRVMVASLVTLKGTKPGAPAQPR